MKNKKKDRQLLKAAAVPAGALSILAIAGTGVLAAETEPAAPAALTETVLDEAAAAEMQGTDPYIDETQNTSEPVYEENLPAFETDQMPETSVENTETDSAEAELPAESVTESDENAAEEETDASEETAENGETEEPVQNEEADLETDEAEIKEEETGSVITGDREEAIGKVSIPKTDENGEVHKEPISEWVIERLDAPITAEKISDENGDVLKLDFQVKDVYIGDEAKNGLGGEESTTGQSYVNMTNYYVKVLQARSILEKYPDMKMVDSLGQEIDAAYLNSLIELLEQISLFDPETDLKYIWPDDASLESGYPEGSGTCDVLATSKDGVASFKFHIDSHGWWGYELIGDTLMSRLMTSVDTDGNPIDERADKVLATKYGNFFVIEMSSDENGTWYMLKDTDLEAPYLFISKDKTHAALIDTDFYGENALLRILRTLLGDQCQELKILITHNHPDHANNLAVLATDPWLKSLIEIYWPEGEAHTVVNGTDVVALYDHVHYMKDMEEFDAGGTRFQFIQIPQEHTPMGGAFADLDRHLFFSGDTLGAQIHLGGTNVSTAALDSWIDGVQKIVNYLEEHGIRVNFGGHSNYACTADFAKWMLTALEEARANLEQDPYWASQRGSLVIIENGKPVTQERMGEMMANGLSDTQELNVLSVNFRNPNQRPQTPDESEENKDPQTPETPDKDIPDTGTDSKPENEAPAQKPASGLQNTQTAAVSFPAASSEKVSAPSKANTASTSVSTPAAGFSLTALISAAGAILFRRKRR